MTMARFIWSFLHRWRRGGRQRFAVLLHARNLVITDDEDVERVGAAYTWCDVEAGDESGAIRKAIDELVNSPSYVQEVRNRDHASIRIDAEEVIPLESNQPNRSTGVVFYVAVDGDTPHAGL